MAGEALTYSLNRKAGTLANPVAATLAANIWAGTTGLSLVGALNTKALNPQGSWVGLAAVLNQLAGTSGLGVDGAARAIP